MANKAYSQAFRREAVALGRVLGAEVASAQLGIGGKDTLLRWMAAAGDPPELQGAPGQWQRLFDLAHARAEAVLASGKLSAVQLATVMGIAQRNIREAKPPEDPPTEEEAEAQAYWDVFLAAVEERWPDHVDTAMDAMIQRYDDLEGPTTYAEDWEYLESLGDLATWHERDEQARRAAWEAQLERTRQAAEVARLAALDAETRGLVEAAEQWLKETAV